MLFEDKTQEGCSIGNFTPHSAQAAWCDHFGHAKNLWSCSWLKTGLCLTSSEFLQVPQEMLKSFLPKQCSVCVCACVRACVCSFVRDCGGDFFHASFKKTTVHSCALLKRLCDTFDRCKLVLLHDSGDLSLNECQWNTTQTEPGNSPMCNHIKTGLLWCLINAHTVTDNVV